MMRLIVLIPFAVAACGSQPVVKAENASVTQVAAQAQAAVPLMPGEWKGTTHILAMNMPGMPADALKSARSESGTSYSSCLTKEQVEKPPAEMFGGKAGVECRYEHFTVAGGKLDALMVCTPKGSGEMRMTMSGSYTPDKYDVTSDMAMKMPGNAGGQTMTVKARTTGARVGACKA